jgi:hypothetical protein
VRNNKTLAERGVAVDILFDETARQDLQAQQEHNPLGEVKFLPKGILTPAAINIFKKSTIIFPAEEGDDPLLIMIKSKAVADSFRAQFNILWHQQARVITGLDGPRQVVLGILEQDGENVAMGISLDQYMTQIPETMEYFYAEYAKRGRYGRLLTKEGERLYLTTKRKQVDIKPLGEIVRHLPKEYFSPLVMEAYGTTLAIVDWSHPITTIFIEKKEIADGFRKYFDALWKMARP